MIIGIDTASVAGNKNINWLKAKSTGLSFVILRAAYGDKEDVVFRREWVKLEQAQIVRGAYLFLRFPHKKYGYKCPDAITQAKKFCDICDTDRYSIETGQVLPPTIDVEFPGTGRADTGPPGKALSAPECLHWVVDAATTVRNRLGCWPMLYTSARVWKEDLINLPAPGLIDCPLWLTRYPFKAGPARRDPAPFDGGKLDPHVPPPWGDAKNWWVHQYQGNATGFPGVPTGNVDMNRFNVLAPGASGERVRWLQRKLKFGKVDGKFGSATNDALRILQAAHNLVPDGVVGPKTFAALAWS